jgi:hypothetical protein
MKPSDRSLGSIDVISVARIGSRREAVYRYFCEASTHSTHFIAEVS